MPAQGTPAATLAAVEAPLGRRLASLFYEALLLAAVLWCAAVPLALVEAPLGLSHSRLVYQLYLATIAGAYFVWQWVRGGRTLAMKTWHLKLVAKDGAAVTPRQALLRYVAALVGFACIGLGFLWAFLDRRRLFLHDRVAGTRIVTSRP